MKKIYFLFIALILSVVSAVALPTATAPAGSGTQADPYQISSLENLYWMAYQVSLATTKNAFTGAYFIQTADIDASATSDITGVWKDTYGAGLGNGFLAIGTRTSSINTYFEGNYDGQNYKITNLYISNPSTSTQCLGLFGHLQKTNVIKNVRLENVFIETTAASGGLNTGALIGAHENTTGDVTVTNCYSTGTVKNKRTSGNTNGLIGGLIGQLTLTTNPATISNCYSSCTVIATPASAATEISSAAGLIGYVGTAVNISNCYATGAISGASAVGGLIGRHKTGTGNVVVTNSYFAGTISQLGTGTPVNLGTILGWPEATNNTFTNCYYDKTVCSILAVNNADASGTTGKTTSEMKTQSTFSGWDYIGETTNGTNDYWGISSSLNNGYPVLTWQFPLAQAASSVSNTSFTANWSAVPATNWSPNPSISYYLDVATDAGFTSLVSGYNNLAVSSGTSQSVSSLTANTQYNYRVRYYYNSKSTSANSNAISALTLPAAPTAASADNITGSGFTANWTAPTQGIATFSYTLEYGTLANLASGTTTLSSIASTNLSQAIAFLAPSTTYYYRVKAVNATGSGTWSNIMSVTTTAGLTANPATNTSSTGFTANWSGGGATDFSIDVSTAADFSSFAAQIASTGNVTTYNITGLNANTTYYYRVIGNSVTSNSVSLLTYPGIPSATAASPITSTGFTANWTAPSQGAATFTYTLEYGTAADLTGATSVTGIASSTLNQAISSLTANTVYYYRVKAVNATGATASNILSTTTLPNAPTATAATGVAATGFTANWTAPASQGAAAFTYTLEYGTAADLTGATSVTGIASSTLNQAISSLTANTVYYYRVKAVNAGGATASSILPATTLPFSIDNAPAGTGTALDPYQISSLRDLYWMAYQVSLAPTKNPFTGAYFIQTADIDASPSSNWKNTYGFGLGNGFLAIGTRTSAFNTYFEGNYDGQNYKITGLYISNPTSTQCLGLFGHLQKNNVIKNVRLENVFIETTAASGGQNTGALIGAHEGSAGDLTVTNCYSTGTVSNYWNGTSFHGLLGGLIGQVNAMSTSATISNCYSTCNVIAKCSGGTAKSAAGGLIGLIGSNANISNCYATGNVSGGQSISGFIGKLNAGSLNVTNSYSTGTVTTYSGTPAYTGLTDYRGTLLGWNNATATFSNCYYDNSVTTYKAIGVTPAGIGSDPASGATGKTTSEMTTQTTYTGWDFSSVWKLSVSSNNGYPDLKYAVLSDISTNALHFDSSSDVAVQPGVTLTVNSPLTVSSLTVAPGAKLTHSSGTLTATNGITLESDATGTGTLMDSFTEPTTNATVKQFVTAGRNWYMSAPINNTASPSVLNRGASVQDYDELNGVWELTSGTLTRGKGYIQVASSGQGTTGTVSFNGTLNSGNVSVTLTNTPGKGKGFNLVGNPYPSYLSWSAVAADNAAANMPTGTMWYRTIDANGKSAWAANTVYNAGDVVYNGTRFYTATSSGTSAASSGPSGTGTGIADNSVVWDYAGSMYVFATVSLDGTATPSTVSNLIPPMQAFWVKSNGGTLTFTNAMRTHETVSNRLKTPKSNASEMPLVRLKVTNGVSADEAVIYASTDASNALDVYDAPKYFNTVGSNQPEIYTQVGNEKLVINAMSELTKETEIPLGFATERGSDFTISASELRSIGADMQLVLKDKQTKTEFNLNDGKSYSFSSDVVNSTDRFSILFRAPGSTTQVDNAEKMNVQVFVNAANQITIVAPVKSGFAIYSAMGQMIESGMLNAEREKRNTKYTAGVYVVKVNNVTERVIVK